MRFIGSIALQITCIILFGCHVSNQVVDDPLLTLLDANQDKVKLELCISDIADIYIIPLKFGHENVLIGRGHHLRRFLFVFRNEIFIGDWSRDDPKLVVFNFQGEPLRLIGSYGRGPGEYTGISGFIVDTLANEVIIYDRVTQKFVVYSTTGRFKRERLLEGGIKRYTEIENINDQFMLAYNGRSKERTGEAETIPSEFVSTQSNTLYDRGKAFTLYDKQTLSEVDFSDFEYAKPAQMFVHTLFSYVTTTKDGAYITNPRTDTIYFIDRNLKLFPKFVDITDYPDKLHQALLFPIIETDKYIFFSVEIEGNPVSLNKPKQLVYDKDVKQFFRINTGFPERPQVRPMWNALFNDRFTFPPYVLTLNHNYVSILMAPEYLWECYNELPENFKEITKNLKEDDNPLLVLIKIKELII